MWTGILSIVTGCQHGKRSVMWPWKLLFIVISWWYLWTSLNFVRVNVCQELPLCLEKVYFLNISVLLLIFSKTWDGIHGWALGNIASFRMVGKYLCGSLTCFSFKTNIGFPTPCRKGWYHVLWRKHAAILGSMPLGKWTNWHFIPPKSDMEPQKLVVCTPLKFNMEPENDPLEKKIPFGNYQIWSSVLNFGFLNLSPFPRGVFSDSICFVGCSDGGKTWAKTLWSNPLFGLQKKKQQELKSRCKDWRISRWTF